MGLPVTFSGKPVLHKHVNSGENSRDVCSRGLNRAPRFTVQVFTLTVCCFVFCLVFFLVFFFFFFFCSCCFLLFKKRRKKKKEEKELSVIWKVCEPNTDFEQTCVTFSNFLFIFYSLVQNTSNTAHSFRFPIISVHWDFWSKALVTVLA